MKRKSTRELDEMLHAELKKDSPDGDLVREISHILEEREMDSPVEVPPEVRDALEECRSEGQDIVPPHKPVARSWILRAASLAAVVCLAVGAMTEETRAETFWEKLQRWKEEVVEFFAPTEAQHDHSAYVFQTDHEGLQEVYDAVTSLGVTAQVVPMWIPEEYELEECTVTDTPTKTGAYAIFSDGERQLLYSVDLHATETWREYHKDESEVTEYEFGGVVHNIMQNNDNKVAIWEKDSADCFLSIDSSEKTLNRIIKSIYTMENG